MYKYGTNNTMAPCRIYSQFFFEFFKARGKNNCVELDTADKNLCEFYNSNTFLLCREKNIMCEYISGSVVYEISVCSGNIRSVIINKTILSSKFEMQSYRLPFVVRLPVLPPCTKAFFPVLNMDMIVIG